MEFCFPVGCSRVKLLLPIYFQIQFFCLESSLLELFPINVEWSSLPGRYSWKSALLFSTSGNVLLLTKPSPLSLICFDFLNSWILNWVSVRLHGLSIKYRQKIQLWVVSDNLPVSNLHFLAENTHRDVQSLPLFFFDSVNPESNLNVFVTSTLTAYLAHTQP